jgi:beta propeller repeat protein
MKKIMPYGDSKKNNRRDLHILINLIMLCFCSTSLILAPGTAVADGVTIITHGWGGETTSWIEGMLNAIWGNFPPQWNEITEYTIHVRENSGGLYIGVDSRLGTNPLVADSGEIVIRLSWSDVSTGSRSTGEIAAAVVPALLASNTIPEFGRPLSEYPIHLIGFSRGGSLVCEIARLLGEKGVWVDHITTLDPVPCDGIGEPQNFGDAPANIYKNVLFADNYWQENIWTVDPDGQSVSGAYNRKLVSFGGGYPLQHFDVHLWYHGTIDTEVGASDGTETITEQMRQDWWNSYENRGANAGYYYSRLFRGNRKSYGVPVSGGERIIDGYHEDVGGYGDRVTVSQVGAQWPNIIDVDVSNNDFPLLIGESLYVTFHFQDRDSRSVTKFYLDDDKNPYNGTQVYLGGNRENSLNSNIVDDGAYLNTGAANAGSYYLLLTIEDGAYPPYVAHKRYMYAEYPVSFTDSPPGKDFTISSMPWDDDNSYSDRDGVVEGWETADLTIQLKAKSDVRNVEANLESFYADVEIKDGYNWYGTMSSGQTSYGDGSYRAKFNFNSREQCFFVLNIDYQKDNVPYSQSIIFEKKVYLPGTYSNLTAPDYELDDSAAIRSQNNNDGRFQSGEEVRIRPRLCNLGIAAATDIDVTLLCDEIGVEVTPSDKRYVDLAPGACGYPVEDRYFWVRANQNFTGTVYLDMQIIWDQGGSTPLIIPDAIVLEVKPAPWIRTDPRQWDFGVSGTDQDVIKTVTIRNVGTQALQVTGIVPSIPAASWVGDPLPWTIQPGGSKDMQVVLDTASVQGFVNFDVVIQSNGRLAEDLTPLSDRINITGLVSDAYPAYQIPGVMHGGNPDVSGNIIVWGDTRNGNWDIYAYDLASGTEFPVCTDPGPQDNPRISGNIIVWDDWRHDNGTWTNCDVYGYDMDTGQEFAISTTPADEDLIGISNGKVAFGRVYYEFTERSNADYLYNLWLYDCGTKTSNNITNFVSNSSHNPMQTIDASEADFGGGMLVWHEAEYFWRTGVTNPYWEGRNGRVKKMQMGVDSAPVQVLGSGYYPSSADTNRFVWAWSSGSNPEQVWLWNNGSTIQITTDDYYHGQDNLAIGGDLIIYDKELPGLYYWDISTGEEYWLTEQTSNNPENCRIDGHIAVWERYDTVTGLDSINYAFVNLADISVLPSGITFSDENPCEGDLIDVNVVVRNLAPKATAANITVKLFDGDPDAGGTQIGSDRIISGGLAGRGNSTVIFTDVPVGFQGEHLIYASVYVPGEDNPANNTATKTLVVQDSDTEGPVISNVIVQEYNGNGNVVIEGNEQILISWQATDGSGIESSWCTIDANDYLASGTYYVVVGPYATGNYTFTISATDGDISPETSEHLGGFTVAGLAGDFEPDGDVDFADLEVLADQWLQPPGNPSADIAPVPNGDGIVNFLDFALMAENWMK